MKIEPIKPDDAEDTRNASFPSEVIQAFNNAIIANLRNGVAKFKCKSVAAAIANSMGTTVETIYANHWMDVEPVYRAQGWDVEYDKPGFNETYDAIWIFKKSKKRG